MAKSGAYIRDVQLLEHLNNRIVSSCNEMSMIDANVVNYINGVRDTLENQLDIIQARLAEAEANLSSAESALTVCQASQAMVAAMGAPPTSCMAEECAVEAARAEVEKWRMRYQQGQQIVGECQQDISGYASGGHALVLNMSEHQTPKANQLLRGCIDNLQNILGSDMANNFNANTDVASKESVSSHSDEERIRALKDHFRV